MIRTATIGAVLLFLAGAAWTAPAAAVSAGAAGGDAFAALADSVAGLGLGEAGFAVGARLTGPEAAGALERRLEGAYPGTFQFRAGDAVVVVDERTHTVLAVYRRHEEAAAGDVREMMGQLMVRFGEPTTTAHGNLVYWAYGPDGRIDDETYQAAKAGGSIDILATVKFVSGIGLGESPEGEDGEQTGAIYYIIASDRLLAGYLAGP